MTRYRCELNSLSQHAVGPCLDGPDPALEVVCQVSVSPGLRARTAPVPWSPGLLTKCLPVAQVICAHVFQRSWGYKGKGRVYILSSSCKCLGVLYMSALGPGSGQDRPAAEQTRNGLADWVRGEEG